MGGLGVEWREDDIESIPDDVAREGQRWGFFADGGATGTKWTRELFGEIELPSLAGRVGVEELTMNLSGRYTDDEFYGSDTTLLQLGYRPFRPSASRRAPSARPMCAGSSWDQTGFVGT
jgi:iron complex outermembrane receptor protein